MNRTTPTNVPAKGQNGFQRLHGDTCKVEGCSEPRHQPASWRGKSTLCYPHFLAYMRESNAKYRHARKSVTYAAEQVYHLWANADAGMPQLWHGSRRVFGIRAVQDGYEVVLEGADETAWVPGYHRFTVVKVQATA